MSFTVSESSKSSNTFLVPAGTHIATAFGVVGVGLQETAFGTKNRVFIGWEVHDHRFQWEKDGVKNDLPATIWRPYNVSMHKNSTLRFDLEAWRGKRLTTEEAKGFDLFSMVGQHCELTLEHNAVGEKTFCNIASVRMLVPGLPVPPLESEEIRYLRPTHEGDWNLVPEFLRKLVEAQVVEKQPGADEFKGDNLDDIKW